MVLFKNPVQFLSILKCLFIPNVTQDTGISFRSSLLLGSLAFCIALSFNLQLLKNDFNFSTLDGHMNASFELAINRVLCGKTSHVSANCAWRIMSFVGNNLQRFDLSINILDIPTILGGIPTNKYCDSVVAPSINQEYGLMLINVGLLRIFPDLSFKGLALALTWIKFACIFFFGIYIVHAGIGFAFVVLINVLALNVLRFTITTHAYSSYPFLMPFILIYIQLLGVGLSTRWNRHYIFNSTIIFLSGILGVFIWNTRTSYIPIILVVFFYT